MPRGRAHPSGRPVRRGDPSAGPTAAARGSLRRRRPRSTASSTSATPNATLHDGASSGPQHPTRVDDAREVAPAPLEHGAARLLVVANDAPVERVRVEALGGVEVARVQLEPHGAADLAEDVEALHDGGLPVPHHRAGRVDRHADHAPRRDDHRLEEHGAAGLADELARGRRVEREQEHAPVRRPRILGRVHPDAADAPAVEAEDAVAAEARVDDVIGLPAEHRLVEGGCRVDIRRAQVHPCRRTGHELIGSGHASLPRDAAVADTTTSAQASSAKGYSSSSSPFAWAAARPTPMIDGHRAAQQEEVDERCERVVDAERGARGSRGSRPAASSTTGRRSRRLRCRRSR